MNEFAVDAERVADFGRRRMLMGGSVVGGAMMLPVLAKAAGPKELVVVQGATHMDLYDGAGSERAVSRLAPFFTSIL